MQYLFHLPGFLKKQQIKKHQLNPHTEVNYVSSLDMLSKINWFTFRRHLFCILSAGCSVAKLDWIRGIQALCLLSWPPKPWLLMKQFYSWLCFWQLCSQKIFCPTKKTTKDPTNIKNAVDFEVKRKKHAKEQVKDAQVYRQIPGYYHRIPC